MLQRLQTSCHQAKNKMKLINKGKGEKRTEAAPATIFKASIVWSLSSSNPFQVTPEGSQIRGDADRAFINLGKASKLKAAFFTTRSFEGADN